MVKRNLAVMSNLSATSLKTLDDLFGPGLLLAFNFGERALDVKIGTWLSALYSMAATAGGGEFAGNILLAAETDHTIYVGASTTTNADGGDLTVNAGAKNGSGTNGVLGLGLANTSQVSIGNSSANIKFNGPTRAETNARLIADPGNAGAISVLNDGVCALTTGGSAQTRTVAIPSFVGQRLTLCLDTDGGGDVAVTFASDIDQSGNNVWTAGDAGDTLELVGATIGGTRAWRMVTNLGGALS